MHYELLFIYFVFENESFSVYLFFYVLLLLEEKTTASTNVQQLIVLATNVVDVLAYLEQKCLIWNQ